VSPWQRARLGFFSLRKILLKQWLHFISTNSFTAAVNKWRLYIYVCTSACIHVQKYTTPTRPSSVRLASMMILEVPSCQAMCHRSDDVALLGPVTCTHTQHTVTSRLVDWNCIIGNYWSVISYRLETILVIQPTVLKSESVSEKNDNLNGLAF